MNIDQNLLQPDKCVTCPSHNSIELMRLGVDMQDWDYVVGLAGNPNTGKSTIFNSLTGLRQHTGNWPGKTVSRMEGGYEYESTRYKVVDLPGAYSLLSTSIDEEIARNFILFGRPDVTVVVVDATRLERNLNLALQILEITDRAVLCLNLMDEANKHGIVIDERCLARDLGIPVVPTVARNQEGLPYLIQTIGDVASGKIKCNPYRSNKKIGEMSVIVKQLTEKLESVYPDLPNHRWLALRLLDGDSDIISALSEGKLQSLANSVK